MVVFYRLEKWKSSHNARHHPYNTLALPRVCVIQLLPTNMSTKFCTRQVYSLYSETPCAVYGVERIDSDLFSGYRKSQLNQALSVLSLSIGF